MTRIEYLLYHTASLPSRYMNVLRGGYFGHTLSARAEREAQLTGGDWLKTRRRVNRLFFWQRDDEGNPDHCARAWAAQVNRALTTIKDDENMKRSKEV